MLIRQYFPLTKTILPDSAAGNIPGTIRNYVGNYTFPQARLSLDVSYSEGYLRIPDIVKKTRGLMRLTEKEGQWTDDENNYEITFNAGPGKIITGLNMVVVANLRKGEPVSTVLETVIRESGIDAGVKKYEEITGTGSDEYIVNDNILNQLGHRFLSKDQMDEAVAIFRLNVSEFPASFLANDALAETLLKKGDKKLARLYFIEAVKLNPDYEYGKKMIEELKNK